VENSEATPRDVVHDLEAGTVRLAGTVRCRLGNDLEVTELWEQDASLESKPACAVIECASSLASHQKDEHEQRSASCHLRYFSAVCVSLE
jgi:hypothetical protein